MPSDGCDCRDTLIGKTRRTRCADCWRIRVSCAVAFSGGVDSAVVAKAAQLALGDAAVAVTGTSAAWQPASSMRPRAGRADRHSARRAPDRGVCQSRATSPTIPTAVSTARASCTRSWATSPSGWASSRRKRRQCRRPGRLSARHASGRRACGSQPAGRVRIHEAGSARLAAAWELPVADKPATPCLSSRVAYGQAVTPERLAMIDRRRAVSALARLPRAARALPRRRHGPDRSAGRSNQRAVRAGNSPSW